MNNFGPRAKDCPNRKAGCSASCEAWNAVKGERLKSYGRRVETSDLRQKTAGGAKNCRRIAEARTRGRNHLK